MLVGPFLAEVPLVVEPAELVAPAGLAETVFQTSGRQWEESVAVSVLGYGSREVVPKLLGIPEGVAGT